MYGPHTPLPYPPQNPDQKEKKKTFPNKKKNPIINKVKQEYIEKKN